MSIEYSQLRIWRKTLKKLKMIAAITECSVIAAIDKMADDKLRQIDDESAQDTAKNNA